MLNPRCNSIGGSISGGERMKRREREKEKKENVWEEEVAGEEGGKSRRRWGRRGEVGK